MSVMEEKPARTRRSFTEEFKRDAVAMVLDDDNKIVDVARRHGVGEGGAGRAAQGERPAADGTRPAQTSDGLLGEGVGTVTRYRWVAARKAEGFPITAACKVAEVSTTAFDDWRRRGAGAGAKNKGGGRGLEPPPGCGGGPPPRGGRPTPRPNPAPPLPDLIGR